MDDEKIPWAPRCSGAAQRRIACELRCDLEMEFRKVGWGDPALLYDEQKDLFRFTEDRFTYHTSAPTGGYSGNEGA
jgi:hypothetical protein